MTRLTAVLARVPMIKFRKGGKAPAPSAAPAAGGSAFGSCPASAKPQAAAPMSTSSTIPDIDLPRRYQRHPPSQEEIDHINGGGIA